MRIAVFNIALALETLSLKSLRDVHFVPLVFEIV